MMEQTTNIPEGYGKVTYSRCGDCEELELLLPVKSLAFSLVPEIKVNTPNGSGLTAREIADKLKTILIDQAERGVR